MRPHILPIHHLRESVKNSFKVDKIGPNWGLNNGRYYVLFVMYDQDQLYKELRFYVLSFTRWIALSPLKIS